MIREVEDVRGKRRTRMSRKRRVGRRVYKKGAEKGGGGRGEEGDMAKARVEGVNCQGDIGFDMI